MTKHNFHRTKCSVDSVVVYRQYHIVYKYLICNLDNPIEIVRNINQISLRSTHCVCVCVCVCLIIKSNEKAYIYFHHSATLKIIQWIIYSFIDAFILNMYSDFYRTKVQLFYYLNGGKVQLVVCWNGMELYWLWLWWWWR